MLAGMGLLLDSFWRATAYCLHKRVIAWSLFPLLFMAITAWLLGYFFWADAVVWTEGVLQGVGWLHTVWSWMGVQSLPELVAPVLVVLSVTPVLVVVSLSLLIPWNVVGTIWQIYGRADIGLLGAALNALGVDYNYTGNATHAWLTVLVMDVWHWTPLVALLCYAGLRSIPDAYYQAARIDGASKFAVFRYIQLPKMRGVLMIAVLLRFMDSFMIYTEPFVLTGGGPGNATTFLSQYLTQKAVGQFDLGPAAAFSLIYFLIILLLCFILYNWMQRVGTADKEGAKA